jgi:hypothetical protein
LRDRSRPRRLTKIAGKKDIKIKRLRVSNKDATGNCVIKILIFNGIIICTIIANTERVTNYRRRRRRHYNIISSLKSETLAAVSLFSN